MSYGSNLFDATTSTSGGSQYSNNSSQIEQRGRPKHSDFRRKRPVIHDANQLAAVGLGVNNNADGFEPGELQTGTTQTIDLNEHFYTLCNGELSIQTLDSPPWTSLSLYSYPHRRPKPEGSWLVNQLNTPEEAQPPRRKKEEMTSPTIPYTHHMNAENGYFGNTYLRGTISNQASPANAHLPNEPCSVGYHPTAGLPNANQSYPNTQIRDRTTYASNYYETNATRYTSEIPSAYRTNIPSTNARQLNTFPETSNQSQGGSYSSTESQHFTSPIAVSLCEQSQFRTFGASPIDPCQSAASVEIPRAHPSYRTLSAKSNGYFCSICDGSFTRESSLDRHLETMHGNTFYECDDCGCKKRREDKMQGHCRKDHHREKGNERYSTVNG